MVFLQDPSAVIAAPREGADIAAVSAPLSTDRMLSGGAGCTSHEESELAGSQRRRLLDAGRNHCVKVRAVWHNVQQQSGLHVPNLAADLLQKYCFEHPPVCWLLFSYRSCMEAMSEHTGRLFDVQERIICRGSTTYTV